MATVQYELMRPNELERLVEECPVAWIPVGTLEWHGRHLPVGLDALKAHALCVRAAEQAGGVVLPPDYFSILGMMFPWTFKYPLRVVARSVFTTLRTLHKQGFRTMFLITGHYPLEQVVLLMGIAEAFMTLHRAAVVGLPEFAMAGDIGYFGDHAAQWETSLMMELMPKLVDKKQLRQLSGLRGWSLFREGIQGVNPADEASPELGREAANLIVNNFAELAERLRENPDPAVARDVHAQFIKEFLSAQRRRLDRVLRG